MKSQYLIECKGVVTRRDQIQWGEEIPGITPEERVAIEQALAPYRIDEEKASRIKLLWAAGYSSKQITDFYAHLTGYKLRTIKKYTTALNRVNQKNHTPGAIAPFELDYEYITK